MSARVLERLLSDGFAVSVGFLLPAPALRRALGATEEVRDVIEALTDGALPESSIETFLSSLLGDLRKGERFPHDLALAALAVALEDRPTAFAEGYLRDLSRLRLAEMSVSVGAAQACLHHRRSLVTNLAGSYPFHSGAETEAAPMEIESRDPDLHDGTVETGEFQFGEAA
jgi:hypothetical protein